MLIQEYFHIINYYIMYYINNVYIYIYIYIYIYNIYIFVHNIINETQARSFNELSLCYKEPSAVQSYCEVKCPACRFFLELNEHLLQTLIDVSSSDDRTLTSDHMKSMGLDPIGDRSFLMELLEVYGIDVMLLVDNPCCPK